LFVNEQGLNRTVVSRIRPVVRDVESGANLTTLERTRWDLLRGCDWSGMVINNGDISLYC